MPQTTQPPDRIRDRFDGLTAEEQQEYEQHRLQLHLGYGVGIVAAIALLIIVSTAATLAVQGHFDRMSPFLTALGPYLLPVTGGVVGYAFSRGGRRNH
ncbi:MAG: hypothetical protein DLM65_03190 [Candidatus Aeolococcus gillhamiae]|uniref:Uncharacterized protein n=1 Tax=Candidatus Aeolococcus gillhamiae TaxID=3127015 RepID=A0A2W6AXK9_9BACT|nr:MAG: hypothetical protein DLM65_03190 [Candidatus Dormibacter sp. RRmetagenome_bin12]